MANFTANNLPLDTIWEDIQYMDRSGKRRLICLLSEQTSLVFSFCQQCFLLGRFNFILFVDFILLCSFPLFTLASILLTCASYEDFTFDPVNFPLTGMQQFAATLHANNQHFVVIVDPGIHNRSGCGCACWCSRILPFHAGPLIIFVSLPFPKVLSHAGWSPD